MVGWVPIACQNDGKTVTLELLKIVLQDGKNVIATAHAECPTWQEIVLNIYDEQCIMGCERNHEGHYAVGQSGVLETVGMAPSLCPLR